MEIFSQIYNISLKSHILGHEIVIVKDFTFTHYSLGHKSCIDHIIISGYSMMG